MSLLRRPPLPSLRPAWRPRRALATAAAPRFFDYATVTANLHVRDALPSVEACFASLAEGKVDVPFPMHISVAETPTAGPGDCHIKGGYIAGEPTFTVKVATVSFYKNLERGLPPGGGVFCVMDAVNGQVKAVMQENRFLTDLRTGAAGGVAVKHLSPPEATRIGFIGAGQVARVVAQAVAELRPGITGFAFANDMCEEFCADMAAELGTTFTVCESAEEVCASSDVIVTCTPGAATVLEKAWLRPGTTIVALGSDQPTKQELPVDVVATSKYVCDLVGQVSKIGELRSAMDAGAMSEADVHAELGEVINGTKPGREGDEIIVVDLTGTGAQDAAIGGVAWDILSTA